MSLFPGTAFITGAASGIGRQVAISFAREGCPFIVLLDQGEPGLQETAHQCTQASAEVDVLPIQLDIASEDGLASAVEEAVASSPGRRIDYAVNCAGIFALTGPSHTVDPADFDRTMAVNCRGMWLSARAEIGCMLGQTPLPTHDGRPGNRGAIVNVASNLGLVSRADCPAYSASKAAVVGFTRSDAIDYAGDNIRINCICPGIIDTPMTKDLARDDPYIAVAPLKRMGTAQEVADAALFLCSSKATFITGTALSVDGGYVIN